MTNWQHDLDRRAEAHVSRKSSNTVLALSLALVVSTAANVMQALLYIALLGR